MRLGMDLQSPSLSKPDLEAVGRYIKETFEKVRSAFDFYVTGTKVSTCYLINHSMLYLLSLKLLRGRHSANRI